MTPEPADPIPPSAGCVHTLHPRDLTDDQLLAQCRAEAFRGSGPGGQHRNKTSSAVRLTHEPSGLSAVASESRSQHENRRRALQRLRHRIALEVRAPLDAEQFQSPQWLAELIAVPARGPDGQRGPRFRLTRLSPRHEKYLQAVGLVLDLLAPLRGSVSAAAARLGVGTADLVAFLQRDEKLLAHVNRLRKASGLKPLGGA
jgi:hypothetical protein